MALVEQILCPSIYTRQDGSSSNLSSCVDQITKCTHIYLHFVLVLPSSAHTYSAQSTRAFPIWEAPTDSGRITAKLLLCSVELEITLHEELLE